ncbi:PilZ domain-containing protein [Ectothiorhodospira magna]|uniref:PilZ domain-containing protein n=1 Tax=Ectothiorhodospira magna TaxID=867345 RepID=A0A1H9E0Q3_9GAMM|nr:PilZ domain-containing protein [Ectothiorhodospira magna]SEQ18518.1 PilZ domain-containing protein [Ectothiorhodospira magna]
MTQDDPFKDVLVISDRLPLVVESVDQVPAVEEMARINETNEGLLRVCASMDDSPPRRTEDGSDISQELIRIESKLNFLVEMVGALLHAQTLLPPAVPVQLSMEGMGWVQPEPLSPGQNLRLDFYLCPQLPRPLLLYARVIACESRGDGFAVSVLFQGLSPVLEDGIQKMIFRRHRRGIALSRCKTERNPGE